MSASPVRAVSLFTDLLEDAGFDPDDLEEYEISQFCEDPVFRMVARWCLEKRAGHRDKDPSRFDRDEMGIDPEEDL